MRGTEKLDTDGASAVRHYVECRIARTYLIIFNIQQLYNSKIVGSTVSVFSPMHHATCIS